MTFVPRMRRWHICSGSGGFTRALGIQHSFHFRPLRICRLNGKLVQTSSCSKNRTNKNRQIRNVIKYLCVPRWSIYLYVSVYIGIYTICIHMCVYIYTWYDVYIYIYICNIARQQNPARPIPVLLGPWKASHVSVSACPWHMYLAGVLDVRHMSNTLPFMQVVPEFSSASTK